MPVTVFVAPGREVTMATPTCPWRGRSRRPVHGALLVAREHVRDLVGIVQRVVELDGLAARVAEHEVVTPFGLELATTASAPVMVLPCFAV